MNVVGILLAAGKGERFDPTAQRLKLLESSRIGAPGGAQPIAALAARSLRAVTAEVIAVVRTEASANQARLRAILIEEGCTLLACEDASKGMGASIACAIRASAHAQGWIIALADMPQVQQTTIAAVRNAIAAGAASAAPFYRGQRGHPVGFGAQCAAELAQLSGDTGAREVLRRHPPVRIDVDDPGVLCDVDEPADLVLARAKTSDGIS